MIAEPSRSVAQAPAPCCDDRVTPVWRQHASAGQDNLALTRRLASSPPAVARCTRSLDRTRVEYVTVVAGHDHHAAGIARDAQECRDLPQRFRRPCEIELIGTGELGINGVMHRGDDALRRIGNRVRHL